MLEATSTQEKKQILLVNDLAGYGKVAAAAMIPILSYMGYPVCNLPTALVSNTFNYGKFSLQENTDYMSKVLPVWKELGFHFDAIATGFMCSDRQARLVSSFCREQSDEGANIFVDPVMGDDGKPYIGVTEAQVELMRQMIGVAHLAFPNYTEACLLTGETYCPEGLTRSSAAKMLEMLTSMGAKSVLITSAHVDKQSCVAGLNGDDGEIFFLHYDEIPAYFHGTGDVFSAIVIGHLLNGVTLKESTRRAMEALCRLIGQNKDLPDKFRGLPLESCLGLIYGSGEER